MITWVSDRSGTASSGVRNSAATPNPSAISTAITVSTRWRPQASISRSITIGSPLLGRRAELALGGHEEVARGHDDLPRAQAAADFVPATGARAELDLARHEPARPEIHEHHVALTGRPHRGLR